jgi:hypothetical protein
VQSRDSPISDYRPMTSLSCSDGRNVEQTFIHIELDPGHWRKSFALSRREKNYMGQLGRLQFGPEGRPFRVPMIRLDAIKGASLLWSRDHRIKAHTSSTVSRISPDKNAVIAFDTPNNDPATFTQASMFSYITSAIANCSRARR